MGIDNPDFIMQQVSNALRDIIHKYRIHYHREIKFI